MIIDQPTVITGSFNFTKAAEEKNAENLLIIKSRELAAIYIDNWRKQLEHSERYEARYRFSPIPSGTECKRPIDRREKYGPFVLKNQETMCLSFFSDRILTTLRAGLVLNTVSSLAVLTSSLHHWLCPSSVFAPQIAAECCPYSTSKKAYLFMVSL
jgi:hypothetical protein